MPSLRLLALCIAALLVTPAASRAEVAEIAESGLALLHLEASMPGSEPRHVPMGLPTLRRGAGIASSARMGGLRLWAAGTGYAVGRRSAGYRLGAGAALPIHESLALTAGYRVSGFSSGIELDGDTLTVDGQIAGAYFGFDLEF